MIVVCDCTVLSSHTSGQHVSQSGISAHFFPHPPKAFFRSSRHRPTLSVGNKDRKKSAEKKHEPERGHECCSTTRQSAPHRRSPLERVQFRTVVFSVTRIDVRRLRGKEGACTLRELLFSARSGSSCAHGTLATYAPSSLRETGHCAEPSLRSGQSCRSSQIRQDRQRDEACTESMRRDLCIFVLQLAFCYLRVT